MTADTPVPRQLSEEERAQHACESLIKRWDDYRAAGSSRDMLHPTRVALVGAMSAFSDESEVVARQYLSLLTALSSEREAGKSDARRMKEHVRGCGECSAGDFCDEGESYGGEVTSNYLYRITAANGCRADAVERSIAERRATRSTGGE